MDKRSKPLILILVLIAFVSALVAFWAVFLRDPTPVLPPDELPSLETNAIPTEDEEKMDQPAQPSLIVCFFHTKYFDFGQIFCIFSKFV